MNAIAQNTQLRHFRADTHIHTCLSPCGDWGMGPRNIAEQSRKVGLDIIAVCDHNSAENAGAVMRAGATAGIAVFPGMEICSKEEVHVVALFEDLEPAGQMQAFVYAHLPGENRPDVWGSQIAANELNEVTGENKRLLIGATTLDLYAIVDHIHELGGVCIASHVDRPAFSIIANLGFIPPDLAFDAVEVTYRVPLDKARETVAGIDRFTCITASDAHFISEIGRTRIVFQLAAPTFEEFRMALRGAEGRRILMN